MGEEIKKREFRTPSQRWVAILVGVGGDLFILLLILSQPDHLLPMVIAILLGVVGITYPALKLAFAAIRVTPDGVSVSNIWASYKLKWSEIERFDIGHVGIYPSIARVRTTDGRTLKAVGVAERTNFRDGSAEALVGELNAELAKQAGRAGEADASS